ncbi:MAG: fibronectin type III domain-containing protein [Chitinophagaceae bacterium]
MKKSFIIFDFLRMGNTAFAAFTNGVLEAMKDNDNFPSPMPTVDKLAAANKVYADALMAASNGDRVKISERDEARPAVEDLLKELAAEVTGIAKGRRSVLISSGFHVNVETRGSSTITPPQNVKVQQIPNTRNIKVSFDSVPNKESYGIYYKIVGDDNAVTEHLITGLTTDVVENLQVGKNYAVYVKVFGSRKKQAQSDTVYITIY